MGVLLIFYGCLINFLLILLLIFAEEKEVTGATRSV
ncbi:MAG: hypothetical protein ACI9LX_001632 [Paraglaciecola sp.]|jgi:hypothetical protein